MIIAVESGPLKLEHLTNQDTFSCCHKTTSSHQLQREDTLEHNKVRLRQFSDGLEQHLKNAL